MRETPPEARHRNTRSAQLRAVLSDMRWHHSPELSDKCGHRFGAAIERIRKGLDKASPWEIESDCLTEDKQAWRYRWTGAILEEPQLIRGKKRCLNCEALRYRVDWLERSLAEAVDEIAGHYGALTPAPRERDMAWLDRLRATMRAGVGT